MHEVLERCLNGSAELAKRAILVARAENIRLNLTALDAVLALDEPDVLLALTKYYVAAPHLGALNPLLKLLAKTDHVVVQTAAQGLAKINTPDAVPHLRDAKKRLPRSAHKTVDDAILAIQSRVAPDVLGGLTLDREHDRGRLSLEANTTPDNEVKSG